MTDESEAKVNEPATEQADIEARASRMGWVPEDEWNGPADLWKDAKEFVETGENELPILRERNRALDRQLQESTRTLKGVQGTLEEFKTHHANVEQRAYDRAVKDIEAKQRTAVAESDTDTYDALQTEKDNLEKPEAPKVAARSNGEDPADAPDFIAWKSDNSWYENDLELTVFTEQAAPIVARKYPDLRGRAFFDKVSEEVKRAHPDKFKNPRRRQAPAVEGAGDASYRQGGGKTYADLDAESKQACDRFVKQGLITREQYLKEYEWD